MTVAAPIRAATTTHRPECANTLNIALKGIRGKGVSIKHTANAKDRARIATNAIRASQRGADDFEAKATQLATTQLYPREYFNGCLDDILDVTVAEKRITTASIADKSVLDSILTITALDERRSARTTYENAIERRKELLNDILNRYESPRNNGKADIRGTAWAAMNAVTENLDHSPLWRANKDAESRFERVLLGSGDDAKQAAFNRALQMTAG